jgi:hypothetical protein
MRIAIVMTAAVLLLAPGMAGAQTYSAILTGSQETPNPVVTPATGTGSFTLDAAKVLSYNISFSNLSSTETAAHIHCCAAPGAGASPLFTLPLGSPKVGTFGPLTAQQESDLNAGLMYVNIHSSNHGSGEIRGQILSTVAVEKGTWPNVKRLYRD